MAVVTHLCSFKEITMKSDLKAYTAPKLEDWGKVVDLTLNSSSAFGGKGSNRPKKKKRRKKGD